MAYADIMASSEVPARKFDVVLSSIACQSVYLSFEGKLSQRCGAWTVLAWTESKCTNLIILCIALLSRRLYTTLARLCWCAMSSKPAVLSAKLFHHAVILLCIACNAGLCKAMIALASRHLKIS